MRSSFRTPIGAVLLVVVLGISSGCQPTGSPRCDTLVAQLGRAETYGYRIRCDPPFAGVSGTGRNVVGWTDHKTRTIWMWPDKIPDSRALRKVAWHELGHIAWSRGHRTGTQAQEERWADGFAYCAEPIQGVGYAVLPTDCRGYR